MLLRYYKRAEKIRYIIYFTRTYFRFGLTENVHEFRGFFFLFSFVRNFEQILDGGDSGTPSYCARIDRSRRPSRRRRLSGKTIRL